MKHKKINYKETLNKLDGIDRKVSPKFYMTYGSRSGDDFILTYKDGDKVVGMDTVSRSDDEEFHHILEKLEATKEGCCFPIDFQVIDWSEKR